MNPCGFTVCLFCNKKFNRNADFSMKSHVSMKSCKNIICKSKWKIKSGSRHRGKMSGVCGEALKNIL